MDEWKPSFIDRNDIERRNESNDKKFIESLRSNDQRAVSLAWAKAEIEKTLGIKLTTIELSGLSVIANEILKQMKIDEENKIAPATAMELHNEIILRFLWQFYGINPGTKLRKLFPPDKDKDGKEIWPTDYMYEYFKRQQAKLHNEL